MSYKVIIIDDEPTTIETIVKLGYWEKYNMKVIATFEDAQKALAYLSENSIDLIITDMEMPEMSGVELLKHLLNQSLMINTLVISGYDDFSYVQQAIKAHSIDYILKPIEPGELNNALSSVERALNRDMKIQKLVQDIPAEDLKLIDDIIFKLKLAIEANKLTEACKVIEEVLLGHDKQIFEDKQLLNKFVRDIHGLIEKLLFTYGIILDTVTTASYNQLTIDSEPEQIMSAYYIVFDRLIENKLNSNEKGLNLKDVRLYISRNYAQSNLSLNHLANEFHVTKEYLSRSFKHEFDVNITEFIMQKRMEKAREMIVEEGVKIKEAAYRVGYEDLSYFYRVWKKIYNCTPKESIISKKPSKNS